jgi:Anti-sigma-K factor rskA
VSELVHNGSSQGAWILPPDSHEEFLELCALSTTGELTSEEWTRLNAHLVKCEECRHAKQEYERVVGTTIPALAAEARSEADAGSPPGAWSIEQAEADLMDALRDEPSPKEKHSTSEPKPTPWKHPRLLAIAALILATCSTAAYQIGMLQSRKAQVSDVRAASPTPKAPIRLEPPAALPPPAPITKTSPEEGELARLRAEAQMDKSELADLKAQQSQLEDELAKTTEALKQTQQDRTDINQQLAEAQANAQRLEAKLNQAGDRTSLDTEQALAANRQVEALRTSLAEKDKEIAQDQDLLEHDRDIRNLIGARNVYMAEVHDVAKSGDMQKPFGRVFYTKDKSLVFYGYDLDQQHGAKHTSSFQAWGRGVDQQHAVSLGLLYLDDANQKRWILKFNNAKAISQIDAVFVTVEPEGGSAKPTGKPLLFTSLQIDPNYP